jgi:poly(rC)-binding protein 2/3/4
MSDIDKPLTVEAPNVTLTIRMLMTGKEVGSIIGKGGEIINSIREESGAKIHISDGSIPERIVTVTGQTEAIFKSFGLICKKLEDDGSHKSESGSSSGKSGSVTLRLIVPASQCGSLIGKGGSKIKEIREVTGASVVVSGAAVGPFLNEEWSLLIRNQCYDF